MGPGWSWVSAWAMCGSTHTCRGNLCHTGTWIETNRQSPRSHWAAQGGCTKDSGDHNNQGQRTPRGPVGLSLTAKMTHHENQHRRAWPSCSTSEAVFVPPTQGPPQSEKGQPNLFAQLKLSNQLKNHSDSKIGIEVPRLPSTDSCPETCLAKMMAWQKGKQTGTLR